ncbi:hypothetical protein PF011_g27544, partial [Phytophthora fragariae]
MKFSTFLVAALAVVGVVAAADQPALKTAAEAFEMVQASELPNGVTLTGTTEKIDQPAGSAALIAAKEGGDNNKDDKKEQYGWGM